VVNDGHQISQYWAKLNSASTQGKKLSLVTKRASRKKITRKVRSYTWGGVGGQKRASQPKVGIDFFGSFCIKTKRTYYKPRAFAETVMVAIAPQNKN